MHSTSVQECLNMACFYWGVKKKQSTPFHLASSTFILIPLDVPLAPLKVNTLGSLSAGFACWHQSSDDESLSANEWKQTITVIRSYYYPALRNKVKRWIGRVIRCNTATHFTGEGLLEKKETSSSPLYFPWKEHGCRLPWHFFSLPFPDKRLNSIIEKSQAN